MARERITAPDENIWRILALIAAIFLFVRLDYAPFFNPDEGRYASASLEMARGFDGNAPDWIVPHLNGVPRLNKPPLVYWTAAAAINVFGANEFAGRLPSALAGLGTMIIVWLLTARIFNRRAAWLSAIVWATALFPFAFARILNTDMLLTFAIALATLGIWQVIDWPQNDAALPEKLPVWWPGALIAGVGMGLALLAKGPVGLAFPLVIAFLWIMAMRRWIVLGSARTWLALVVAIAIAVAMAWPWVAAVSERVPHFLHRFLIEENLGRFSGDVEYHKPTPIYYYLPFIPIALLPWSGWLLALPRILLYPQELGQQHGARAAYTQRGIWFLVIWVCVIVGIFSLSSTKLVSYMLPALPALCILIGMIFETRLQRVQLEDDAKFTLSWQIAMGFVIAFYAVLAGGVAWYLSNGKTMPLGNGLPFIVAVAVVCIGGMYGVWRGWRLQRARDIFLSQWLTAVAIHIVLLFAAGRIARYEDSAVMVKALRPYLKPDDTFVLHRQFLPSTIFYLGRPILMADFKNTSGLEDAAIARSPYFISTDGLLERLARDPKRAFVLIRVNNPDLKNLPSGLHIIARSNDYRILSNRPAPSGFSFDYVAPRKQDL